MNLNTDKGRSLQGGGQRGMTQTLSLGFTRTNGSCYLGDLVSHSSDGTGSVGPRVTEGPSGPACSLTGQPRLGGACRKASQCAGGSGHLEDQARPALTPGGCRAPWTSAKDRTAAVVGTASVFLLCLRLRSHPFRSKQHSELPGPTQAGHRDVPCCALDPWAGFVGKAYWYWGMPLIDALPTAARGRAVGQRPCGWPAPWQLRAASGTKRTARD